MNFFDIEYKVVINNLDKFGICDDQDGCVAYIKCSMPTTWTATVNNIERKELFFYPIDFRLNFLRNDGTRDNICDCMLIEENKKILFIELKNSINDCVVNDAARENWLEKGLIQLERTIYHFKIHHSGAFASHKKRQAHLANKARPSFNCVETDVQTRFKKLGFRLYTESTIDV